MQCYFNDLKSLQIIRVKKKKKKPGGTANSWPSLEDVLQTLGLSSVLCSDSDVFEGFLGAQRPLREESRASENEAYYLTLYLCFLESQVIIPVNTGKCAGFLSVGYI